MFKLRARACACMRACRPVSVHAKRQLRNQVFICVSMSEF
jgi:hypothetical protein